MRQQGHAVGGFESQGDILLRMVRCDWPLVAKLGRADARYQRRICPRGFRNRKGCAGFKEAETATTSTTMSNRKLRFTLIVVALVGANLALWIANRMVGYTSKEHPAVFTFVLMLDFIFFVGLALLGLVTAWLLAFRPETFKRVIERSIAKRSG